MRKAERTILSISRNYFGSRLASVCQIQTALKSCERQETGSSISVRLRESLICVDWLWNSYKNIDPLINKHFGLYAIEYHEDTSVGYDYVVQCLVRHELLFSVPEKFKVTEIDLDEVLGKTSAQYRKELKRRLSDRRGKTKPK